MGKSSQGEETAPNFLKGYCKISHLAIKETWRETQFKILYSAYIPFLHIPDQPEKKKCPKCLMARPTLLHKLWACPLVSKFWDQVLNHINTIAPISAPKEAHLILFHSEGGGKSSPHWVHLDFSLAKRQILHEWVSPEPMLLSTWQGSQKKLMYMDRLHADMSKEARTVPLLKKWRTYIEATLEATDRQAHGVISLHHLVCK